MLLREFAERYCICMFAVKKGILTDEMPQNQQFWWVIINLRKEQVQPNISRSSFVLTIVTFISISNHNRAWMSPDDLTYEIF